MQNVIESFGVEIVGQLEAAAEGYPTAREKFKSILPYVASKPLIDAREICQAELEDLSLETRRKLQAVFQNLSQVIIGIVEDGISGGELRQVEPNIAVFSFMNL